MVAVVAFYFLFIGSIVILIWMLKPGTTGSNRFGDDPKEDDIGNQDPLNIKDLPPLSM